MLGSILNWTLPTVSNKAYGLGGLIIIFFKLLPMKIFLHIVFIRDGLAIRLPSLSKEYWNEKSLFQLGHYIKIDLHSLKIE